MIHTHLPPLSENESSIIHHALVRVRENNNIQNKWKWQYPASIAWSVIDLYFDKDNKGTFDTTISITEPIIEFILDTLEDFALNNKDFALTKGVVDSSEAHSIRTVKWKIQTFLDALREVNKVTDTGEQNDITNI